MEVNNHTKLLLEALQFPGAQDFTLDVEEQNEGFRELVFGLEDKYVRGPSSIIYTIDPINSRPKFAALACLLSVASPAATHSCKLTWRSILFCIFTCRFVSCQRRIGKPLRQTPCTGRQSLQRFGLKVWFKGLQRYRYCMGSAKNCLFQDQIQRWSCFRERDLFKRQ